MTDDNVGDLQSVLGSDEVQAILADLSNCAPSGTRPLVAYAE